MKFSEINNFVGKMVMAKESLTKIDSYGPHGPYKLIKLTKGGKVLLEKETGDTFSVNPKDVMTLEEYRKYIDYLVEKWSKILNATKENVKTNPKLSILIESQEVKLINDEKF